MTLDDWRRSEGRDYYDEITGAKLDPQKHFEAHRVEMEFMTTLNVWDVVPVDECWAETGRAPIGTRWIDQNKGDDARLDYRSRLVAQETRTSGGTIAAGDIAATFAATPPLEVLRLLVSQVMTGYPGSEIVLRFLDVSRAYPQCPVHRKVYIRLPQKDPSSGDRAMCGRLNMALYGARDAGQNFEFKATDVLEDGGCEQGQFSPRVWFPPLIEALRDLHPWRRLRDRRRAGSVGMAPRQCRADVRRQGPRGPGSETRLKRLPRDT